MKKIRITADAILAIVRGIFEDEDVNFTINDPDAPEEWQGKTIIDILNVEYYTFKHRPSSTQKVIERIFEEKGQVDNLAALSCAFGLLSLGNIERLFSKDTDMIVLDASLQYYIQTSKIKLLEYLIEDSNIATCGLRIPVQFGEETRKAVIFFDRPIISDVQPSTPFGEMCLVDIKIAILLYPDVVSYSDYTVNIGFTDSDGIFKSVDIPLTSLSVANIMTQDAFPGIEAQRTVGNVNLSRAKSFVLVFDGYNNDFTNYLSNLSLATDDTDNNIPFYLKITRDNKSFTHTVVIKDHQISVNADTNNETHTLTFVKRGLKNGIA